MHKLSLVLVALALSTGCTLANLTPQSRFQDSAYSLNDAARWGQVDMAVKLVSPKYLDTFIARHRYWGERVSIADADVVRMQIADDRQSATSEVSLSWYDTNGITVRQSTITQKWEADRGNFRLVDESVRGGDPSVFAEPPKS